MNKFLSTCLLISTICALKTFSSSPKDYVVFPKISLQKDSARIYLTFQLEDQYKDAQIAIMKKQPLSNKWESVENLPSGSLLFFDTLQRQTAVEYGIICSNDTASAFGYYLVGEMNEIEPYCGNVLILVDSTIEKEIQTELEQFQNDLLNDCWYSEVRKVPRSEVFNQIEVRKVKRIVNSYKKRWKEKFKVLLLVGRVPVPYTGNYSFDGHTDHFGAFPSDLFYIIDDSLLSDDIEHNITASEERNHNVPFDGKLDQTTITNEISIAVGRIDFSNLTVFQKSEVELLKNYFKKNHEFRLGKTDKNFNCIIDDGFGTQSDEIFSANAYMNFYALCDTIIEDKLFDNVSQKYFRFSYACNSGSYTSIWSSLNSEQCANFEIKSTFLFLLGSYCWDWDSENNLLRSALASSPNVLISAWIGRPFWHMHHFGFGFPFAKSFLITANNLNLYPSTGKYGYKGMHLEVLGDPTIRIFYPSPVQNTEFVIDSNGNVVLFWKKPQELDDLIGYQINKKEIGNENFNQIAFLPKEFITFVDQNTQKGRWIYQIKAIYNRRNKFGSYSAPSLGQPIEVLVK